MTEGGPRITVAVAVLNGATNIQRCFDSVANQTYRDKELIVIDGGSTDGTLEILRANADRIAYWESEPDRGIYHAFNKAIDRATGDWIYFLGCDDRFWDSNALEKIAPRLRDAYPRYRLAFARAACVRPSGKVIEIRGKPWEHGKQLPPGGMATIFHRQLFARNGGFDESYRIAGDVELVLRELKSAEGLYLPDILLTAVELFGMSSSPKYIPARIEERRRALRKHGMPAERKLFDRSYITYATYNLLKPVLGEKAAVSAATELIYLAGLARRMASGANSFRSAGDR